MSANQSSELSDYLRSALVCPRDQLWLNNSGDHLSCSNGHRYPVVDGIPVLLLADQVQTIGIAETTLRAAQSYVDLGVASDIWFVDTLGISEDEKSGILRRIQCGHDRVDPVVDFLVGATNGILYKKLIGQLSDLPIPELRLPKGHGELLLDVGSSWGRWSIAAAQSGYQTVSIDPSLGAVMAARRLFRAKGLTGDFIVGDARFLPFAAGSFDYVFSYSVLQHLSQSEAHKAFYEVGRVLKPGGHSMIQMPNRNGIRCLYHQAKRGFRMPVGFEVRYWTLVELMRLGVAAIGRTRLDVDCFFGIGLQAADSHMLPPLHRGIVRASEWLRRVSANVEGLVQVADSVYVNSVKGG